MNGLTLALVVPMTGVLGGVLTLVIKSFVDRFLRKAQVDDTGASADERRANARKTDAEAWAITRTGLVDDVKRLSEQLLAMRSDYNEVLAHVVDVHEWEAGGRKGPMPAAPEFVTLARS